MKFFDIFNFRVVTHSTIELLNYVQMFYFLIRFVFKLYSLSELKCKYCLWVNFNYK